MKKVNSLCQIQQLDVAKSNHLVIIQSIKLTTYAAEELAKVPNNLHDGLEKCFRKMLQLIIQKIQERGTLQAKLVQNAACLNSINLVAVDTEALQRMFDRVATIMFKKKRISSLNGDKRQGAV